MNAQALVTKARALAFMPNTSGFSDQDLLDEINIAQQIMLVPAIVRASGEYFTEVADVPVDSNGFARIPSGAFASTSRMLSWVFADGREGPPLVQLSLTDIHRQANTQSVQMLNPTGIGDDSTVINGVTYTPPSTSYTSGGPAGGATFTFVPDGIQVYGGQLSGMVRVRYSRAPGLLTLAATPTANTWTLAAPVVVGSAVVTGSIDSGTGIMTVTGVISGLIQVGQILSGDDVVAGNVVTAILTGTGGDGTYQTSIPSDVASTTITATGGIWVSTPTPVSGTGAPSGPLDITDALTPHRLLAGSVQMRGPLVLVSAVDSGGPGDALAARVLAGSYLTAAGTTYIPQYADEWHNLILYYGAARLADLRKDSVRKASLLSDANSIREELTNIAQPRSKNNVKRISASAGWGRRR